jgi:hypothetical protein
MFQQFEFSYLDAPDFMIFGLIRWFRTLRPSPVIIIFKAIIIIFFILVGGSVRPYHSYLQYFNPALMSMIRINTPSVPIGDHRWKTVGLWKTIGTYRQRRETLGSWETISPMRTKGANGCRLEPMVLYKPMITHHRLRTPMILRWFLHNPVVYRRRRRGRMASMELL